MVAMCWIRWSCSVSLTELLANQVTLVVVLEGNLCSELTSVGKIHTVSRVSQEPWTGYIRSWDDWHYQSSNQSTFLELHLLSSARPGAQVLSYSLSINAVINNRAKVVESCGAQRFCYLLGRLHQIVHAHKTACQRLCTRPHPSDSVAKLLKKWTQTSIKSN